MLGLSAVPRLKATTIWPEPLAVAVKSLTRALFCPACAKMSKFDSTLVPLIATLNVRWPAAVKDNSTKCRRTV